ncbi:hypothetical protein COBT_002702 [Conglomerata obtusa]
MPAPDLNKTSQITIQNAKIPMTQQNENNTLNDHLDTVQKNNLANAKEDIQLQNMIKTIFLAFHSPKKLHKNIIITFKIPLSFPITTNLKQNSHILLGLAYILCKQYKYLIDDLLALCPVQKIRNISTRVRNNHTLPVRECLMSEVDFESSVFRCFSEARCVDAPLSVGDYEFDDVEVMRDGSLAESMIRSVEDNICKKRKIDTVIECESSFFMQPRNFVPKNVLRNNASNNNFGNIFNQANNLILPLEIINLFNNNLGNNNSVNNNLDNINLDNEIFENSHLNINAENVSVEMGRNDFSVINFEPNYSEYNENTKITDESFFEEKFDFMQLQNKFIFNEEINFLVKKQRSQAFLDMLSLCSENKIKATQEFEYGAIYCEIIMQ